MQPDLQSFLTGKNPGFSHQGPVQSGIVEIILFQKFLFFQKIDAMSINFFE
jgi:hypothetical protein